MESKLMLRATDVDAGVGRLCCGLNVLLMSTFEESDRRYNMLSEEFSKVTLQMVRDLFEVEDWDKVPPDKVMMPSNQRLRDLVSYLQGRVLTLIEAAFPVAHQCDALKSLATGIVWDFDREMHSVDRTKHEEK